MGRDMPTIAGSLEGSSLRSRIQMAVISDY